MKGVEAATNPSHDDGARYRLLSSLTCDIMLVFRTDGQIVEANPAAVSAFGYSHEELLALSLKDLRSQETWAEIPAQMQRLEESGSFTFENIQRHKDGTCFPVEANWSYTEADGERVILSIVRDLSERKRSEEINSRLASIVQSSGDAIIGYNLTGIITSWNPGAERLFGYTEAEALGQPVAMLIPADLLEEEPLILDILRRGNPIKHYETIRRCKDGTPIAVSLTVSPLKNARGEIVGASKIARDITERKQMEQEIRDSRDTLQDHVEELAAVTEQLLSNNAELEQRVAERTARLRVLAGELTQAEERERRRIAQILHDGLQQLLIGATLHLQIMRKHRDPRSCLEELRRVEELITESNDLARSLSHELSPITLQQGNLPGALKWLADWMNQNHHLTVRVEADEATADLVEDTVKVLLFQSVRELLLNVIKHAGVKRARVQITVTPLGQLEIVVSDRGKGFDPTRVQTDHATHSGIGLFSIHERLHLLGGRMDVESEPGRGSRFRLLAPLQKLSAEKLPLKSPLRGTPAQIRHRAARVAPVGQTGIRVVLADDHKVMRDGLAALLNQQSGIEVVGMAANGQEAINLAKQLQPDLMVMDINMQHMDGIQATREIIADWPGIKVIGLTLHADTLRHAAMLEAGAVNCLSKNSLSRDLIKTIHAHATFDSASTQSGKRPAKKTLKTRANQV